ILLVLNLVSIRYTYLNTVTIINNGILILLNILIVLILQNISISLNKIYRFIKIFAILSTILLFIQYFSYEYLNRIIYMDFSKYLYADGLSNSIEWGRP